MNCPKCNTSDYYLGFHRDCVNPLCEYFRNGKVNGSIEKTNEKSTNTDYNQFVDFCVDQEDGLSMYKTRYKAPLSKYTYAIWRYSNDDVWSVEIRNESSHVIDNSEIYNLIKNMIGYPSWNGKEYHCAWNQINITEEQVQEVYETLQDFLKETK